MIAFLDSRNTCCPSGPKVGLGASSIFGAEGSIFAGKRNDEFLREMIDRARRLDEEIKQAREEEQTNG